MTITRGVSRFNSFSLSAPKRSKHLELIKNDRNNDAMRPMDAIWMAITKRNETIHGGACDVILDNDSSFKRMVSPLLLLFFFLIIHVCLRLYGMDFSVDGNSRILFYVANLLFKATPPTKRQLIYFYPRICVRVCADVNVVGS